MPIPFLPPPRARFSPLAASLLVLIGLVGLSLGCRSDQVMHYRVPKEAAASHPDHPGHDQEGLPPQAPAGADLPQPPAPTGPGSLKWSLPKGWSQLPGSGMRYATLQTPYSGRLEATVTVFPGQAGGELANVNRWRGQINMAALDAAGLAKVRVALKTKAGALNVYDFTSEDKTKGRLVAGYISTPDGNTWFLKLTGDTALVAKAKPEFMRILESLHLD